MYLAVIESWSNIYSFATDKETAKRQAVTMARQKYSDDYDLKSWTWAAVQSFFGSYIIKIDNDIAMDEDAIKAGCYDNIMYD